MPSLKLTASFPSFTVPAMTVVFPRPQNTYFPSMVSPSAEMVRFRGRMEVRDGMALIRYAVCPSRFFMDWLVL